MKFNFSGTAKITKFEPCTPPLDQRTEAQKYFYNWLLNEAKKQRKSELICLYAKGDEVQIQEGFFKGEIGTVELVFVDTNNLQIKLENRNFSIKVDVMNVTKLAKVEPKKPKLEKGMKFKTKPNKYFPTAYSNEIFTVNNVDVSIRNKEFIYQTKEHAVIWFGDSEIDWEETKKLNEPKFKVGDRVKILGNEYNNINSFTDKLGVILDKTDKIACVKTEENPPRFNSFPLGQLEKIEDKQPVKTKYKREVLGEWTGGKTVLKFKTWHRDFITKLVAVELETGEIMSFPIGNCTLFDDMKTIETKGFILKGVEVK